MKKAMEIARYIYSKGITDKIKLQKMLYISFGFYGAMQNDSYLFDEKIEAWQYGPVIPEVYNHFSTLKDYPLVPLDIQEKQEKKAVNRVIALYGKKRPFDLVTLTHSEGTPWSKHYVKGQKKEIKKSDIIAHYKIILMASVLLLKGESRKILKDFAER